MNSKYSINQPTLGLSLSDNHRRAVTLSAGKVVEVVEPANDKDFVVVSVNDEKFQVAIRDLVDRGTRIEPGGA